MLYEKIKNVAIKLIPRKILIGQEQRLRELFAVLYKGANYQCPVCEKNLKAFVRIKAGDKLCPYCGSPARHRRLWTLLHPRLRDGVKVLDFSPPRCFYRKLKELQDIEYVPTDFAGEFLASKNLDITLLELDDNSFDLIICYHVLEHVDKDIQAMRELFRVLKPNGACFIQTPFKTGDIYENPSITDPKGRLEHFGQEDHVRTYSIEGISERLASVGFKAERLDFSEPENNYYGFDPQETVLVATK